MPRKQSSDDRPILRHPASPDDIAEAIASLTQREQGVMQLIATGLSNNEIAGQLNLSINSIKTYVRGAYRRLGIDTRSQAVRLWISAESDGSVKPLQGTARSQQATDTTTATPSARLVATLAAQLRTGGRVMRAIPISAR